MTRPASDIVRHVPGQKPTATQVLEGRAAAIANHGPTHGQIQLRAFQIYEAAGRLTGSDVRDGCRPNVNCAATDSWTDHQRPNRRHSTVEHPSPEQNNWRTLESNPNA